MKIVKCTIKCFFLLLVTALFWAMPANTWGDVTVDGIKYYLDSSKMTASVTGYSGFPTDVTIPDVINDGDKDYTVTEIGRDAFYECTSLISIEIPASVTKIGEGVFSACTSLTSVKVDENNKNYGVEDGILYDKDKTILIYCPGEYTGAFAVPSSVTSIGKAAFNFCTSLTSIEIPAGVTEIGSEAFSGCTSLTSIEIPASVTKIGGYAFAYCFNLKTVTFAEGSEPEYIGDYAFLGCIGLTSIKIPASVNPIWDTDIDGTRANGFNDPKISFNFVEGKLVLTFTGTLEGSEDGKQWTAINATSPYTVEMTGGKKFFRAVEVLVGNELGGTGSAEVGKSFIIPLSDTVELEMIWVEPGTFMMGSPKDELGREGGETQHQVTLTKGYWLGKYEVTQGQYKAVMGSNPSCFKGENLPVEQVTWYEAMDFCARLTEIERAAGRLPEGYEYRLPTEAQWEYACRAGTTTALNSGKNLTDREVCPNMDEVGWYYYNGDQTHPVGGKQPNNWGFYDMHGNVYEWCLDWFGDYPTGSVTDPTGPATGSFRVLRSGCWCHLPIRCRSAHRDWYRPSNGYFLYGFRVALSPVQ